MQQNFYFQPPSYPLGVPDSNTAASVNPWSSNPVTSTPVSAAMYTTTSTASWAHTVPTLMPWVTEANDSKSSTNPVVRFSAPFPPDPCTSQTATAWELMYGNLSASKTNANVHLKRRNELDDLEVGPQKQYVTEEKMAARMQEMHISNQYTVPLQNSPFGPYGCDYSKAENTAKSIRELESMLPENDSGKTKSLCNRSIVLAPEIKSLVEPEKLFSKAFVNQIERPTMAVVLWKPPQGCVQDIMESNRKKGTSGDRDNNFISSTSAPASSSSPNFHEANNNRGFSSEFVHAEITRTMPTSIFHTPSSSSDDVSMEA